MTTSRQSVVVDKSFLQGSSGAHIRELAADRRLLMCDSLFYELLTTSPKVRAACFRKLPTTENPVDLVHHTGRLVRIELDAQRSAGRPSDNLVDDRFEFHPGLRDESFELAEEARKTIDEQTEDIRADIRSIVSRARDIDDFFEGLRLTADESRIQAIETAEQEIAYPGSLREFIGTLPPPAALQGPWLPPSIDESWAVYRWLQVQMLFSLELFERYRGEIPEFDQMTVKEQTILEHDIHDAQGLALGCLEGAFAANETKLKRWFKLLCPGGALFVSPIKGVAAGGCAPRQASSD